MEYTEFKNCRSHFKKYKMAFFKTGKMGEGRNERRVGPNMN